jgi:hypothetical protein
MQTIQQTYNLLSVYADLEFRDGYFAFVQFTKQPANVKGSFNISDLEIPLEFDDVNHLSNMLGKTLFAKFGTKYPDLQDIKFDFFYLDEEYEDPIGCYDNRGISH